MRRSAEFKSGKRSSHGRTEILSDPKDSKSEIRWKLKLYGCMVPDRDGGT